MSKRIYSESLKRYCLESIRAGKDKKRISEETGVSLRHLRRWAAESNKKGDAMSEVDKPKYIVLPDPEDYIPEGQIIKGMSVLYGEDGQPKMHWVKTNTDQEYMLRALEAAVEALNEKIEPAQPIKFTKQDKIDENLLSCYVITDFHMGQLSWGEETGADWDLEIAEKTLIKWFEKAIECSPNSHTGVLAQLGDFLHTDGFKPLTPASGHILDADSRFPKMVRAATRVLRKVIDMMLDKHKRVHLIMADANHDPVSSVWLSALFKALYENEPRITVDSTQTTYYHYEWGETSLFFHHGHKKKINEISRTFAGLYREVFGRTKYSYGHIGHYHHQQVKEDSLMVIEQHPTLAAKDAYSANGGYLSNRGANVITYSKKHGEVARNTIRPEAVL